MKKVLLTMILFISSFFFFNLKDVSAATYTYVVREENFSLINDEFFDFRDQVIEFSGDSKKYVIYYNSGIYKALIADNDSSYSLSFNVLVNNVIFYANNFDLYDYIQSELIFNSSITSEHSFTGINYSSGKFYYLDTNIEDYLSNLSVHKYNVKYNGVEYPINTTSLYDVYLENFAPPEPEDPYEEEKSLLSSFYTCVIEKISYLANEFASNYIFLTILGVFVLIFVIELIRRYLT